MTTQERYAEAIAYEAAQAKTRFIEEMKVLMREEYPDWDEDTFQKAAERLYSETRGN